MGRLHLPEEEASVSQVAEQLQAAELTDDSSSSSTTTEEIPTDSDEEEMMYATSTGSRIGQIMRRIEQQHSMLDVIRQEQRDCFRKMERMFRSQREFNPLLVARMDRISGNLSIIGRHIQWTSERFMADHPDAPPPPGWPNNNSTRNSSN